MSPNYSATNYSGHDIEIYRPLRATGKELLKLESNADKYRHRGREKKKKTNNKQTKKTTLKFRPIKLSSVLKNHFVVNTKRPWVVQHRISAHLHARPLGECIRVLILQRNLPSGEVNSHSQEAKAS